MLGVLVLALGVRVAISWRSEEPLEGQVSVRISEIARRVHEEYMAGETCALLLLEAGSRWAADLARAPASLLLLRVEELCAAQTPLRSALHTVFAYNCRGYIVQAVDPECFLTLWEAVRVESVLRHSPRVLFLPAREGPYAADLFSTIQASYHTDLLALEVALSENATSSEEAVFGFFTNDFHRNSAEPSQALFLGNWPTEKNLYPDKISDLKGKVLRYATLQYPPYAMVHPFDGMEVRMAKEFCRKYNCSLVCVSDDFLWGQIFDNGTGNGVVGLVFMDEAELGAGAVYVWEKEQRYLSYSAPYLRSRITCLVPKPARVPAWTIPLLPFSTLMWIVQLLSILLSAGVLYTVNKAGNRYKLDPTLPESRIEFESLSGTFLRSWGMSLLQPPSSRLITGSPLRLFFTLFETLFLFFTTMYSSALSSYLTVPTFYPPIDSAEDLWRSGLRWAADHDAWIYSLQGAGEPHWRDLLARFETHSTPRLLALSTTTRYAFTIEIMAAGHVTDQRHLSGEMLLDYHVMKHPLYTEPSVTVMRKGSPYKEKLDMLVHRTLDAGLLLLWEGDVTVKHLSSRLQTALQVAESTARGADTTEPTILRLNHIQGAFVLLTLGLLASTLLLLGERYSHARNHKAPARGPPKAKSKSKA